LDNYEIIMVSTFEQPIFPVQKPKKENHDSIYSKMFCCYC